MPMSDYLHRVREKVGHDLLVLPSAAVALFDDQQRLLVGQHSDRNIWVLPGGLIEPGETPADAAIREAWEETGLVVEVDSVIGVYGGAELMVEYRNGDRTSYIATVFRGTITGGELRPDGDEILELRYLSHEQLIQVPHGRWMDVAFGALFGGNSTTDFQRSTWRP